MILSLLLVVVGSVLSITEASSVCEGVYPHVPLTLNYKTETTCVSAGGCWAPSENVPCYFPKINGYKYTEWSNEKGVLVGNLTMIAPSGALGPDFPNLTIKITQETKTRMRVKIYPTGNNVCFELRIRI